MPVESTFSRAGWSAFSNRLGQSYLGRTLQMGIGESFGIHYAGGIAGTKGINQGFLGIRGTLAEMRGSGEFARRFRPGGVYKMSMQKGMGRFASGKAAFKNAMWASRTNAKGAFSFVGKTLGKSLGLLGTAAFAYMGYQEGGLLGAAKGIGESGLYSWGTRAALGVVGSAGAAVLATAAVAGIGTYALGEAAKTHERSLSRLEFGGSGSIMDAIGSAGAATNRQRAVMALQNTHLNGRAALGNEALLYHTSFR